MADDFSFKVVRELGVLSTSKTGWNLELNTVDWNNRGEKYDIRSWSPDHQKMGKGITLSAEELKALSECIGKINLE